jgi:SIR2-like domain
MEGALMATGGDSVATVAEGLADGTITPFLGAGVNLAVPGRPTPRPWKHGELLPSGSELAQDIAQKFEYPLAADEHPDLLRVAQFAALRRDKGGLGVLYDWLRKLFDADYPPTPVHTFFARLPRMLEQRGYPRRNLLFVTTNYDDALERALRLGGETCDVVWYAADGPFRGQFWLWENWPDGPEPDQPIEDPTTCTDVSTKKRTVVLKIHGAVDRWDAERDSFVITEDHYIDYLTKTDLKRIPVMLAKTLRTTSFLFLGYSLSDWNMRAFMHSIWEQQNVGRMAWSIQADASEIEKKFWDSRDVLIENISLITYIAMLEEAVGNLPVVRPAPPAVPAP